MGERTSVGQILRNPKISVKELAFWDFGAKNDAANLGLKHKSMMTNLLDSERGLNFRPRSEFANEGDFLHQFLFLARPKLTKKLFFQLPAGVYLTPNGSGFENMEIAPESERAAQWKSIYPGARQRLCEVYRNKAHYEAMLAEGQKICEEKKKAGIAQGAKSSGKSGSAGQPAALTALQVMSFAMQPVPESTQAIKLVFKLVKGVPESEFYREVPQLAVETIKAYKMSGKIEFLSGNNSDGKFILCAGFEPFEILPDTAHLFNARMTSWIPIAAHKGGKVKLDKAQCATEELKKLRGEYADQGKFVFIDGKVIGHPASADSLIGNALGIKHEARTEADFPEIEPEGLIEAKNDYVEQCAEEKSTS